jgi:hypothetical protein
VRVDRARDGVSRSDVCRGSVVACGENRTDGVVKVIELDVGVERDPFGGHLAPRGEIMVDESLVAQRHAQLAARQRGQGENEVSCSTGEVLQEGVAVTADGQAEAVASILASSRPSAYRKASYISSCESRRSVNT